MFAYTYGAKPIDNSIKTIYFFFRFHQIICKDTCLENRRASKYRNYIEGDEATLIQDVTKLYLGFQFGIIMGECLLFHSGI